MLSNIVIPKTLKLDNSLKENTVRIPSVHVNTPRILVARFLIMKISQQRML